MMRKNVMRSTGNIVVKEKRILLNARVPFFSCVK